MLPNKGEYSVRGIKSFRGTDGIGYNASLYRGGKKIAFVIEEGNGGEADFHWFDKAEEPILRAFVDALPPVKSEFDGRDLKMDYGWFVTELVDEVENEQKQRRACKTHVLWRVECFQCGNLGSPRRMYKLDVYDDPWQEAPKQVYLHQSVPRAFAKQYPNHRHDSCQDLLFDTGWGDFRYFTCDSCGRIVIRQCPRNGWHSYVHITEDGEEICLKCYEQECYKGLPRASFENGQIPGMFFNRGDLEEHGYGPVVGFDNFKVDGRDGAKQFCDKAIEMIDAGHRVAVDYERMAIGGIEGYVTLYATVEPDQKNLFGEG